MATATLTTDLVKITSCDTTTDGGTWSGVPLSVTTSDPEPAEGVACLGGIFKSTTATLNDSFFTPTVKLNLTGKHLRFKCFNALKATMKTQDLGGLMLSIYDGVNTGYYKVSGSDVYVGGWETLVLDCSRTPDQGTQPNVASVTNIGIIFTLGTAAKNVATAWFDWISIGEGIKAAGGTSGDEIGFTHIDTADVYYDIISKISGVFRLRGKLQIGQDLTTASTYFKDSGKVIIFDKGLVNDSLYELKVIGNSTGTTIVNLAGNFFSSEFNPYLVNFSNGTYVTSINIDGTTFQKASTGVTLCNKVTGDSTIFDTCGTITVAGAALTNCVIKNSSASAAMLFDTTINNSTFISSGVGHAIQINSGTTFTFNNLLFTGYATANGSTGNEAVFVNIPSGSVTINISGGSTPSYRTAGATVSIVSSANLTFSGLKAGSEVRAYVGTDPATAVEIGGIESSGTSFSFAQSVAGQSGYIMIFALGYISIYLPIVYSSLDQTIPVQQQADRQYANN